MANLSTWLALVSAAWVRVLYSTLEQKPPHGSAISLFSLPKSLQMGTRAMKLKDACSLEAEKAMASHSSALAWKIPWTEEPGGLQCTGLLTVGHNWTTSLSHIGEGNGNPLQCSCLENPRDRGAWWAAIYGVAQSWTRLKWLSSSTGWGQGKYPQTVGRGLWDFSLQLTSNGWALRLSYQLVSVGENILDKRYKGNIHSKFIIGRIQKYCKLVLLSNFPKNWLNT